MIKGGAGFSFMKELAMSGGNTVICWDTAKLGGVLDEAASNHLSVIIGIDIPGVQYFDVYKNEKTVTDLLTAYRHIVVKYKDHPAALAWCIGNELTFPFSPRYDSFYDAYNKLLDIIHKTDPNHPVCTTVINIAKKNLFNIKWRIPALDFIGINIYNSLRTLQEELNLIRVFWNGPYFISEWAPRGGWETKLTSWDAPHEKSSTEKAKEYYDFYVNYMPLKDPRFLGSLVFYWGSRFEYTHTFYSIFNEDGCPTEIAEALKDCWNDTLTPHQAPAIKNLLLDGNLTATDNIVVGAGSRHTAKIFFKPVAAGDTMRYSWEIIKEDWSTWGKIWVNFKKPVASAGLLADSTVDDPVFTAPLKEGPYRIFVIVYNSKGYCATANTPFYVVE